MDATRFDRLTRSFSIATSPALSRRDLLPRLAVTVLGLGSLLNRESAAKQGKKKRKKKLVLNQFGCVNVGGKCRGNSANCCSGVCEGKKPKKGKKDKSRCVAHNERGCTPARQLCTNPTAAKCAPPSDTAFCTLTTGNAGFCAQLQFVTTEANCVPCSKDTDCVALGFGVGSACVLIRSSDGCASTNSCEGVNGSAGTACLPPVI